jgi:feruloyl esterase
VWIPPASVWNGKFQGVGNGGYSGALDYRAMTRAVSQGYAVAGHNTGHDGDGMEFGQGHPEKVADYAYRAVHVMTENAKLLVRVHTGRFAGRSYFVGCSAGGHQALSEAQRYPEDYDGIIAGAPANNRIRQTFGFVWFWMAAHPNGQLVLPASKLPMVSRAVLNACDAIDGLRDGLIDDPRRCGFDPVGLLCRGKDNGQCLTQIEVEALRKLYGGLTDPKTGARIFAGFSRGSEDMPGANWLNYIINPAEPMRVNLFRYFVFHDPAFDWRTLDWERDLEYADRKLGFMNATERNLAPFEKRGGKLLMYAGWSDPVVPPEDTVAYYEGVAAAMGGLESTRRFARLFMAPGMGHCGGGPGPSQFDALSALDQWVNNGKAPEYLIASHAKNGVVDRTRPLCPYPQVASYKGTGSIDEAANFACVAPPAPGGFRH